MTTIGRPWSRRTILLIGAALNILTAQADIVACVDHEIWSSISAADYVAAINPGWNLGNTLDAIPTEGSWNNPPVIQSTFDDVAKAGFKSVRIPVTYTDHYVSGSPDWTINSTWLQRVEDVVDMALDLGLYVITNVHHDSWQWADVTASGTNLTMIEEKLSRTWDQIASRLACKSSKLALEPINEPPANTAADGAEINKLNDLFVQAVVGAGGHNPQRVVTLVGGSMDSIKTSQWFKFPTDLSGGGLQDFWAVQYHYYSPYDFIFGAWGKTIWGSDADKAALEADLANIRGNFTDVPLVIGEASADMSLEPAARCKYMDYLTQTAVKYNTSLIIWDNGETYLDRTTHTWRDPQVLELVLNAAKGQPNSLSDSTTDPSATSQSSSAYIFHKVGDEVIDQTVSFLLNGNTIASIQASDGTTLSPSTDYTVSGGDVTIKSSWLANYLSATAQPGRTTTLTVTFSAGATAAVDVYQWDVPTLGSTSSKAVAGSDLPIPITWKGVSKVAAVKMISQDGTYLFDDWTQYLSPLQQGRATYNNQWNYDGASVRLTAATVAQVISKAIPATFTFEFYPRVPGNAVNYTLTV